jgi:hypothetical protein
VISIKELKWLHEKALRSGEPIVIDRKEIMKSIIERLEDANKMANVSCFCNLHVPRTKTCTACDYKKKWGDSE